MKALPLFILLLQRALSSTELLSRGQFLANFAQNRELLQTYSRFLRQIRKPKKNHQKITKIQAFNQENSENIERTLFHPQVTKRIDPKLYLKATEIQRKASEQVRTLHFPSKNGQSLEVLNVKVTPPQAELIQKLRENPNLIEQFKVQIASRRKLKDVDEVFNGVFDSSVDTFKGIVQMLKTITGDNLGTLGLGLFSYGWMKSDAKAHNLGLKLRNLKQKMSMKNVAKEIFKNEDVNLRYVNSKLVASAHLCSTIRDSLGYSYESKMKLVGSLG